VQAQGRVRKANGDASGYRNAAESSSSCALVVSASQGTDKNPVRYVQALSVNTEAALAWPTALKCEIILLHQHYFLL